MDKPITNKRPRFHCYCRFKKHAPLGQKKPVIYTWFPEKYRKIHGTNKLSSLTAVILRLLSWDSRRGCRRENLWQKFLEPWFAAIWGRSHEFSIHHSCYLKTGCIFSKYFITFIVIFLSGGGLGSIANSNLALSFFPTSQRFDRSDLPKSNVNISRHIFDNFPPKKCNCSDFWMDKKVISQTLPGILLSLCSPFAATLFFPVFVRGVWCDSTISDINLSDSVQDLVAEKPPRRGSHFFSTWENLVDFLQNGSCLEVPWRSRQFLQSYHAQS